MRGLAFRGGWTVVEVPQHGRDPALDGPAFVGQADGFACAHVCRDLERSDGWELSKQFLRSQLIFRVAFDSASGPFERAVVLQTDCCGPFVSGNRTAQEGEGVQSKATKLNAIAIVVGELALLEDAVADVTVDAKAVPGVAGVNRVAARQTRCG